MAKRSARKFWTHVDGGSLVKTARWIYFDAEILRSERRFDRDDDTDAVRERNQLFGLARIDRDRIALAENPTNSSRNLKFYLEVASGMEGRGEWTTGIGYNVEVADVGISDEWFMVCRLPELVFRQISQEFLNGEMRFISGACRSEMWLRSTDAVAPLAKRVTWYLEPGKYSSPKIGLGRLTTFRWSLAPAASSATNPYRRPVLRRLGGRRG